MNRPVSLVVLSFVGLVAVMAAGPTLIRLTSAIAPLVLMVGIVVASLRVVWYLTRNRW